MSAESDAQKTPTVRKKPVLHRAENSDRGHHDAHRPGKPHESSVSAPDAGGEPEAPSRVWPFFVAIGIILVLLVGITVYTNYQRAATQQKNQYNGFDFAQAAGGIWVTRLDVGGQPYDVPFYTHPRDTELVLVDKNATYPVMRQKPDEVIISVDPDAGSKVVVAAVEIARILGKKYNFYNLDVTSALSRPVEGKVDLPVLSCRNVTESRVVIQFVKSKIDAIHNKGNCIVLEYSDVNQSIVVADRFAYMLLKIM